MAKKDPRIDAYIEEAEPFARPILKHIRKVVHRGAPGTVETIKWGFPHFDSNGGPMASMASFKAHCSFGFWKASLIGIKSAGKVSPGMGTFGRITSLRDLPSESTLVGYVKKAAALNAAGVKVARKKPARSRSVTVPAYFERALAANKKASAVFEAMSPSHRREYVAWLDDAKADDTRQKRLEQALVWIAEGKNRNWKYERK